MTDQEYTASSATWRREFVEQLRDLRADLNKANERLDRIREQQHSDRSALTDAVHKVEVAIQEIKTTGKTAWFAAAAVATALATVIPMIIHSLKAVAK